MAKFKCNSWFNHNAKAFQEQIGHTLIEHEDGTVSAVLYADLMRAMGYQDSFMARKTIKDAFTKMGFKVKEVELKDKEEIAQVIGRETVEEVQEYLKERLGESYLGSEYLDFRELPDNYLMYFMISRKMRK